MLCTSRGHCRCSVKQDHHCLWCENLLWQRDIYQPAKRPPTHPIILLSTVDSQAPASQCTTIPIPCIKPKAKSTLCVVIIIIITSSSYPFAVLPSFRCSVGARLRNVVFAPTLYLCPFPASHPGQSCGIFSHTILGERIRNTKGETA